MAIQITRISILTGVVRTRELPITREQYDAWEAGVFVQDAFPDLPVADREFIMTGMTQEEWDSMAERIDLEEEYEHD